MSNTTKKNILSSALRTIKMQAASINELTNYINEDFVNAVNAISTGKGRLVISGIGKSAIVAQKIVATMNSTGTPALFMHAADAIHGDLGMIQQHDIVLIISKSGNSPEIKVLIPLVKNFGNVVIGMVGNMQSYLAGHCDIVLNTTVTQEACPNNLAPTNSTTAQMVMGDALAICLVESKDFTTADFAKFHPGGALGKQMYLKVGDVMALHEKPVVSANDPIKKVIVDISKKRLGATVVLNADGFPEGIVTDGDIRRMFEKYDHFNDLMAKDVMSLNPKMIEAGSLAVEALQIMKQYNISQLVVMQAKEYNGVVHLHDLIREGII
ncbi:MAG: SIS domain-containing protein [Ferruginibacter sp.]